MSAPIRPVVKAAVQPVPQVNVGDAPPPLYPGLAVGPQTYPDIELLKRFLRFVQPVVGVR